MHSLEIKESDERGFERLHGSLKIQPGADAFTEPMMQRHQEIMKKLECHEQMLNRLLARGTFMDSSEFPRRHSVTSSCGAGMVLKTLSAAAEGEIGSNGSSPGLFQSYTAHDLELKEEAQAMHTEYSKKKVANNRLQRATERYGAFTQAVKRGIEHPAFDTFFGIVVLLNALEIGCEVQSNISGQWFSPSLVRIFNYGFTSLFTLELLARFSYAGRTLFWSHEDWVWNWLDLFIVSTSITEIIVAAVLQRGEGLSSITGFRVFRLIRMTRIVKAIRLMRIVRFVSALRTLVSSIVHTLKALFWALVLLGFIVYVFAVLFAQAVHDHAQDPMAGFADSMKPAVEEYFSSVPRTMLTLFMSITGGVSWEDVIHPLLSMSVVWVLFFLFYVSFTTFAVLNVVTGVFCQSALENAQKDHQAVVQSILDHKESHLKKIRALFLKLGADDTGFITFDMLEEHFQKQPVREYFESLGLDVSDAWSFFKLLDMDAGGVVEIEEFLMGCLRLRGQARAIDTAKLLYDQNWLIKSQGRFQAFVEETLFKLSEEVKGLSARRSKAS